MEPNSSLPAPTILRDLDDDAVNLHPLANQSHIHKSVTATSSKDFNVDELQ